MVGERIIRINGFVRMLLVATGLICVASPLFGRVPFSFDGSETLMFYLVGTAGASALCVSRWVHRPLLGFYLAMLAELMACSLLLGFASYVAAQTSVPLFDGIFSRIDQAIGFDWPGYLRMLRGSPVLTEITKFGYYSMVPQFALLLVVLTMRRQFESTRLLMAAFLICALSAIFLSAFFPALPAYHYYGMITDTAATDIPRAAFRPYMEMTYIRSGDMLTYNVVNTTGIVAFPSFHTMMGVVLVAFTWSMPWLRLPSVLLNAALIAGTPTEGGHFLCDVIAGFILAVLFIAALRAYARHGESTATAVPAGATLA